MTSSIGALQTHYQLASTTTTTCIRLIRSDGTIVGLTECDKELEIDLGDGVGPVLYKPDNTFARKAIDVFSNLKVSTLEIEAAYSADLVKKDIVRGLFKKAKAVAFYCNWADPQAGGQHIVFAGRIGEITHHDFHWEAELVSLENELRQANAVPVVTQYCRYELGDSKCRVKLDPNPWAADQHYVDVHPFNQNIGDIVVATTYNDRFFHCTVPGYGGDVEPTWSLTEGATTVATAPTTVTWASTTTKSTGDYVEPTTPGELIFRATNDGDTGAVEPTWPTAVGETVVDGDITWEAISATPAEFETVLGNYRIGTVSAIPGDRIIAATGITVSVAFFGLGRIVWLTGENAGTKQDVEKDDGTGLLQLFQAPPFDVQIGDTFQVFVGCYRDLFDCRDFHRNSRNHGGFPFLPTTEIIGAYPASSEEKTADMNWKDFFSDPANAIRAKVIVKQGGG